MNVRIALGAAFAVVVACSSEPPPIGSDSGADTGAPDASNGDAAASDATTEGGGGDGGACTLTSPPSNPTCATCIQSHCCTAWNSCSGSADCASYITCARACFPDGGAPSDAGSFDAGDFDAADFDGNLPPPPDGGEGGGFACVVKCEKAFPNGVNDGSTVIDCEDNACSGSCP